MQDAEPIAELAYHAESGDCDAQYRLGVLFLSGQRAEQDLAAARRWFQAAASSGHVGAKALGEMISQVGRSSSARQIRRPMWLAAIPVLAVAGLSMYAGYEASKRVQTSPSTIAQGRAPSELSSLAPKAAAPGIPANAETYSLQPPNVHATVHAGAPAAGRHKARSHKPKAK
jgi:uncharacterized protein